MSVGVDVHRSAATYTPKDDSGTVVLQLDKPLPAGSSAVCLKGAATRTETKLYPYIYPNGVMVLAPMSIPHESAGVTAWSDGSKRKLLGTGKEDEFTFRFLLPADSPRSSEEKYGMVAYCHSVPIDRISVWWNTFKGVEKSWNFTVLPSVDLNRVAKARKPIRLVVEKVMGLTLSRSKKVIVKVFIPKSGFVPGEVIPVHCDINNNSSNPVVKATTKLYKRICYDVMCSRQMKKFTKETVLVEEAKELSIAPTARLQVQLELTVPPTISTLDKSQCSVINIDYYLEITFTTKSLLNKQIKLRPSVLIGTVPLTVDEPPAGEENVVDHSESNNDMNESSSSASPPVFSLGP